MPQSFFRVMDIVVGDSSMCSHTIVPQRHRPIIPFHPHLNVGRMGDVLRGSVSMNRLLGALPRQWFRHSQMLQDRQR